ncbi:MAG: peptidylprolyl isomerase [Planctomycetaceae bacterium]|nr:peptidylprolyl isomerase [Planctomycetaceae bacterium]
MFRSHCSILPALPIAAALAAVATQARAQSLDWLRNPANGRWYAETAAPTSWSGAEALAQFLGGHLTTVRSQAESDWLDQNFFSQLTLFRHHWIGLRQDRQGPAYSEPAGGWGWASGEPLVFTNWAPGQPDNAGGRQDFGRSGGATGGSGGAAGNPVIEMDTSLGKMVFELDPKNMPGTTANFLAYVDAGFYTNTIIHRVVPDFVIQGGGYSSGLVAKSANPPIKLEISPAVLHDYGALSMARTSDPDSADTQFFVVNAKAGAHNLDGNYAAFGKMLEGSAVLDAISGVTTQTQSGLANVPVTEVVVKSVVRK